MSFVAKYFGRCDECGEPIRPGDEVEYVDEDTLQHIDCTIHASRKPAEVCTVCWIEKPCECEDI